MVYCVEDDASIRELALYALTQAGIEAEGMANDVEFRAACARRLPDAVMLDIMLPGADGLEILHRIRNTPGLSRVPVIMVTAKSTELDIVTALESDYAGYKLLTNKDVEEALATAKENGILDETRADLDDNGQLRVFYRMSVFGGVMVNQYL